MRAASLVALLALSACDVQRRSTMTDAPVVSPLGCELKVLGEGPERGLAFVLVNHTGQPRTVRYIHPFILFQLRASADGRDLQIIQPEIDIPGERRELVISPGGSAELGTPIHLRVAAAASKDRFVWTIVGLGGGIELRATVRIDGESIPPCVASWR
jgi:hypothetical protein